MSAAVHTESGHDVEAINTDIITLTRFLTEEQTKVKEATGDFTYVEPPPPSPNSPNDGLLHMAPCENGG